MNPSGQLVPVDSSVQSHIYLDFLKMHRQGGLHIDPGAGGAELNRERKINLKTSSTPPERSFIIYLFVNWKTVASISATF